MNNNSEKNKKQTEEGDKIIQTHLNDDSNNQYEKTASGEIKYLNENIIDMQRSDEDIIKNDDNDAPRLTDNDRVI